MSKHGRLANIGETALDISICRNYRTEGEVVNLARRFLAKTASVRKSDSRFLGVIRLAEWRLQWPFKTPARPVEVASRLEGGLGDGWHLAFASKWKAPARSSRAGALECQTGSVDRLAVAAGHCAKNPYFFLGKRRRNQAAADNRHVKHYPYMGQNAASHFAEFLRSSPKLFGQRVHSLLTKLGELQAMPIRHNDVQACYPLGAGKSIDKPLDGLSIKIRFRLVCHI
jgi:hypothetical protein